MSGINVLTSKKVKYSGPNSTLKKMLGIDLNNHAIGLVEKKVEELLSRSEALEALKVAVEDLLTELRIDEISLNAMAEGYSPDYPGSPLGDGKWDNPYCKVQLSKVVAQKLRNVLLEQK